MSGRSRAIRSPRWEARDALRNEEKKIVGGNVIRWNVLVCASIAAISILPAPGLAQAPPAAVVQAEGRLVSHEVLPDRRVTFRRNAPKASQVALNFQAWNAKPQP